MEIPGKRYRRRAGMGIGITSGVGPAWTEPGDGTSSCALLPEAARETGRAKHSSRGRLCRPAPDAARDHRAATMRPGRHCGLGNSGMENNGRARRIAVISGKGGVGKTVIAGNLAAALASTGCRTLVLDADLGLANLDIVLGVDPEYTVEDVLGGACSLDDALVRTPEGFDLLAAGSGLQKHTLLSKNLADGIEALLGELGPRYDIVLFDVGAGLGYVVLFFANLADRILVVVTPEPASLLDAYASIKVLRQLYGRHEFFLAVNRADPGNPRRVGNSIARHLRGVLARFVDANQPQRMSLYLAGSLPQDPEVSRSIRNRKLLLETAPTAASARAICAMADVLRAGWTSRC